MVTNRMVANLDLKAIFKSEERQAWKLEGERTAHTAAEGGGPTQQQPNSTPVCAAQNMEELIGL